MSQAKLNGQLNAIATMSPAQLRAEWKMLSGEDLPNTPASLVRHLIAYHLQEKQLGKLPVQIERQLARVAGVKGKSGPRVGALKDKGVDSAHPQTPILHGTRFLREWNGKTIAVTAVEGGFDWDGKVYRSLSELARTVTGAHWSGPRFFGLKKARG